MRPRTPGTRAGRSSTATATSSVSSPRSRTRPGSLSSAASASRSRSMPRAARSASRWISGRVGTVKDTETLPGDMARLLFEIKKVIVGQDHLLERILVALLARGHLLVEVVPGLAKALSVKTVAQAITGEFKRIQFTPDLVPADLVGTRIYNQRVGDFQTSLGPVFTNLLLADEINRAPEKVQSALLEVMQERQVTIGRETHKVPDPFLVMATQNPIETEGVYQLPEAQVDRFMMKVVVGYPSEMDEFVIVERMTGRLSPVVPVMTTERLIALQREVDDVFVDPTLMEYVVRIATATRQPAEYGVPDVAKYVTYGASPRASINLVLTSRALAFLRGRRYVTGQDVLDLALDVLRHRIVLSFEALSDEVTADDVVRRVLALIPVPTAPLLDFTGVLARLLTRHGNRVGATLFGSRVERSIPARGGRIQVLRLLNVVERRPRLERAPLTSLSDLLDAGLRSLKRRSLVFVVSDFFSAPGWEDRLLRLPRPPENLPLRPGAPREGGPPGNGPVRSPASGTG